MMEADKDVMSNGDHMVRARSPQNHISRLDELVKQPVPDPPRWSRVADNSWDVHLDGVTSLMLA